jgi:hypothetical protein
MFPETGANLIHRFSWQTGCEFCMSRGQTFCIGCLSDTSTAYWAKYSMFFKISRVSTKLRWQHTCKCCRSQRQHLIHRLSWQTGCKCCMSRRQTSGIGCLSDTSTAYWAKYSMFFKISRVSTKLRWQHACKCYRSQRQTWCSGSLSLL